MRYLYSFILFLFFSSSFTNAQAPKREMRSTWLATVWSLDWPSAKIPSTGHASSIKSQKDQMIRILDNLQSININAVFFQVRSRCDAMYQSSYEPWSSDLVAKRGLEPGYDPLSFVLEEAHKRGMEVHAWINPFRFSTSKNYWDGEEGDYRKTNPDWIMTYPVSGTTYNSIMNPGLPEVRQRITDIVEEIITNYDVDGIVFDDYFYAYSGTPTDLDGEAQRLYKPADMTLSDWRRQNINKTVSSVYQMIQANKPYVRFGISPFGIWTTNKAVAQKEGIVLPAGITGSNTYETIYCDPVAWLKEGTVDYISPQLYWTTYSAGQDYDVLCPWWSDLAFRFKKHFYSSHSISAIESSDYRSLSQPNEVVELGGEQVSWDALSSMERSIVQQNKYIEAPQTRFGPEEIGLQINRNRVSSKDGAPGSVFYSTKYIYNVPGVMPYLKKNWYAQKSLVPAIDWKPVNNTITPVYNIRLNNTNLEWSSDNSNVRYTIYAIPNDQLSTDNVYNISTYLQGVSYSPQFTIDSSLNLSNTTLAVAVLDRYGNEYTPTIMTGELGDCEPVTLVYPLNATTMIGVFNFSWNVVNADWYTVEISEQSTFSTIHSRKVTTSGQLSTELLGDLTVGKTYYWRVLSHKAGYNDGVSDVRSFIVDEFNITSPSNGAVDVELTPTIIWKNIEMEERLTYLVYISTALTFSEDEIILRNSVSGVTQYTLPHGLLSPVSTYYAKVKTMLNGRYVETKAVRFTTRFVSPNIPIIISPNNNDNVADNSIVIKIDNNSNASGFQFHLSPDETFPVRNLISKSTSAYQYEVDYGALTPNTYYVRCRANYSGGQTEWSSVVKFRYLGPNSIWEVETQEPLRLINDGGYYYLKIDASKVNTDLVVYMFDITGKLIKDFGSIKINGDSLELPIELNQLAKGIYLIKAVYNQQSDVFKLIN